MKERASGKLALLSYGVFPHRYENVCLPYSLSLGDVIVNSIHLVPGVEPRWKLHMFETCLVPAAENVNEPLLLLLLSLCFQVY